MSVKLTTRQMVMLKAAASVHGTRVHTRHDVAVMERLFLKDLTFRSCNGTDKWFATSAGRAVLAGIDLAQRGEARDAAAVAYHWKA